MDELDDGVDVDDDDAVEDVEYASVVALVVDAVDWEEQIHLDQPVCHYHVKALVGYLDSR